MDERLGLLFAFIAIFATASATDCETCDSLTNCAKYNSTIWKNKKCDSKEECFNFYEDESKKQIQERKCSQDCTSNPKTCLKATPLCYTCENEQECSKKIEELEIIPCPESEQCLKLITDDGKTLQRKCGNITGCDGNVCKTCKTDKCDPETSLQCYQCKDSDCNEEDFNKIPQVVCSNREDKCVTKFTGKKNETVTARDCGKCKPGESCVECDTKNCNTSPLNSNSSTTNPATTTKKTSGGSKNFASLLSHCLIILASFSLGL